MIRTLVPRSPAGVAMIALLALESACYSDLPVTTPDPGVGAHLTAVLTDAGTAALAGYLGPAVGSVEGRLIAQTEEHLVLSVSSVRTRGGIEHYWKGEAVTLPRSDIAALAEHRLAAARTAVALGGVAGGALALLHAFGSFGGGSASGGSPRPPQ
jgi:hypothetical protein